MGEMRRVWASGKHWRHEYDQNILYEFRKRIIKIIKINKPDGKFYLQTIFCV